MVFRLCNIVRHSVERRPRLSTFTRPAAKDAANPAKPQLNRPLVGVSKESLARLANVHDDDGHQQQTGGNGASAHHRHNDGHRHRARSWTAASAPVGNDLAIHQFDFVGRAGHIKSRRHFGQIVIQTFGICVRDDADRRSHDFQNVGFVHADRHAVYF